MLVVNTALIVQSERGDIYGQYALELVNKGHAFYAFETTEELDQMRIDQKEQGLPQKYDGRALSLTQEEVQAKLDAGCSLRYTHENSRRGHMCRSGYAARHD